MIIIWIFLHTVCIYALKSISLHFCIAFFLLHHSLELKKLLTAKLAVPFFCRNLTIWPSEQAFTRSKYLELRGKAKPYVFLFWQGKGLF